MHWAFLILLVEFICYFKILIYFWAFYYIIQIKTYQN